MINPPPPPNPLLGVVSILWKVWEDVASGSLELTAVDDSAVPSHDVVYTVSLMSGDDDASGNSTTQPIVVRKRGLPMGTQGGQYRAATLLRGVLQRR